MLKKGRIFMKCRPNEIYDFLIASEETADIILDKIGFGKSKCEETYQKDGRFGYTDKEKQCIFYGFENKMYGKIKFGDYVVFDIWWNDVMYEVLSPEQFNEQFDVLKD